MTPPNCWCVLYIAQIESRRRAERGGEKPKARLSRVERCECDSLSLSRVVSSPPIPAIFVSAFPRAAAPRPAVSRPGGQLRADL